MIVTVRMFWGKDDVKVREDEEDSHEGGGSLEGDERQGRWRYSKSGCIYFVGFLSVKCDGVETEQKTNIRKMRFVCLMRNDIF